MLNELNQDKASGPYKIHARFWKETSSEINPALAVIYQASQPTLDAWREAYISLFLFL